MLQIPQYVLENLKCSVCDGYLSTSPLMIKPEGKQVCGKCFKIIPTDEKQRCLREVGLEALSQLFLFPCRYNRLGCNYTFPWGNENNHEEVCQYRYQAFSPSRNSDLYYFVSIPKPEIDCEPEQVTTRFSCELKDRNYGKPPAAKHETATEIQNNINLSIEGAASLRSGSYSDIKIKSASEASSLYESLITKPVKLRYCSSCKKVVDDDVYTCLFGHTSCANCRGNMCKMCVSLLEKESKAVCKNYQRGCKNIFRQSEINKHQCNCPYNDHKCPMEPCKFKGVLSNLKLHLQQTHFEKVYATNEITRNFQNKDDTVVFLCYDSVFKCVYFYYKTFVEFFITYVGSSEEAAQYTYEISAQSNGNPLATRRSKCSSWNDSMLERGITFEKKDLVNSNERKLNFEIRLRILHIK